MMEWNQAQEIIRKAMRIGTNLNTSGSHYRFVKKVDAIFSSTAYGYNNEEGFVVSIGRDPSATVSIP